MWIVIWIIIGATLLTSGICSAHAFDKLVTIQRTQFEETWLRDGKPYAGYFTGSLVWQRSFKSGLASQRCSWQWMSNPPNWIMQSLPATLYQRRLKLFGRVSQVAAVVLVASFVARATMR